MVFCSNVFQEVSNCINESEKQYCPSYANDSFTAFQLMECCVNALVTSFKETILAECQGMIKRNETESK